MENPNSYISTVAQLEKCLLCMHEDPAPMKGRPGMDVPVISGLVGRD